MSACFDSHHQDVHGLHDRFVHRTASANQHFPCGNTRSATFGRDFVTLDSVILSNVTEVVAQLAV